MNHAPTYRELEAIIEKINISTEHLMQSAKTLDGVNEKMSPEEIKKTIESAVDELRTAYNWCMKAKSQVKDLGENDPIGEQVEPGDREDGY